MSDLVYKATITEFKAVVERNGAIPTRSNSLLLHALSRGVLINPDAFAGKTNDEAQIITEYVIDKYGVDADKVNSTFYKRFSDVENRSELQLRMEQLLHYVSTYGTGREGVGAGYEPEFLRGVQMDVLNELTYIDAISLTELRNKIKNMLTSGIAFSEVTQHNLLTIIQGLKLNLDYVDEISNREFMCRLCEECSLIPANFDEFTRYLFYLVTGSTLLIKSRETNIHLTWGSANGYRKAESVLEKYVATFGINKVAENITRYRKQYLILRKHFANKKLLNRALKLSKKLYKPRKQSALEHVADSSVTVDDVKVAAKNATIFKLVKVWNALKAIKQNSKVHYYKIRNGKSYLKVNDSTDGKPMLNYYRKQEVIVDELKHRLGDWSNKTFYIPQGISYAVPTSGKDFIGPLPYMSSYEIKGDVSLGVAWDEPADLDLHTHDLDGAHIGWNSSYNNNGVVYSGDMTALNEYGYAAEFVKLTAGKVTKPVAISVAMFSTRRSEVPFDVFATNANVDTNKRQGVATQIGPKSFLFHDKVTQEEFSKALMIVFPTQDGFKVVFVADSYGNVHVPGRDNAMPLLIEAIENKTNNLVTMNALVDILGGSIWDDYGTFQTLQQGELLQGTQINNFKDIHNVYFSLMYTNLKSEKEEYIDLSPSKLTTSTFVDLLSDKKEEG